jgi:hypothetical protein
MRQLHCLPSTISRWCITVGVDRQSQHHRMPSVELLLQSHPLSLTGGDLNACMRIELEIFCNLAFMRSRAASSVGSPVKRHVYLDPCPVPLQQALWIGDGGDDTVTHIPLVHSYVFFGPVSFYFFSFILLFSQVFIFQELFFNFERFIQNLKLSILNILLFV